MSMIVCATYILMDIQGTCPLGHSTQRQQPNTMRNKIKQRNVEEQRNSETHLLSPPTFLNHEKKPMFLRARVTISMTALQHGSNLPWLRLVTKR